MPDLTDSPNLSQLTPRDAAEALVLEHLETIFATYSSMSADRQRQFIADIAHPLDVILYRLTTPSTKPAPVNLEDFL